MLFRLRLAPPVRASAAQTHLDGVNPEEAENHTAVVRQVELKVEDVDTGALLAPLVQYGRRVVHH